MKLNLGCGEYLIEGDGWVNVDKYLPADVEGDIRELDFAYVDEVQMSHLLEHIPHTQTAVTLARVRNWMKPSAKITVEVPDMEAISAMVGMPIWQIYTYGNQAHDGERHHAGFTKDSLHAALAMAGFERVTVVAFLSQHPMRTGMPCLEGVAYVPAESGWQPPCS